LASPHGRPYVPARTNKRHHHHLQGSQPRQGPPPWKVPAPGAADCAGNRGVYPAHAHHRRAQGRVRGRARQPGAVRFFKFRTEIFKNSGWSRNSEKSYIGSLHSTHTRALNFAILGGRVGGEAEVLEDPRELCVAREADGHKLLELLVPFLSPGSTPAEAAAEAVSESGGGGGGRGGGGGGAAVVALPTLSFAKVSSFGPALAAISKAKLQWLHGDRHVRDRHVRDRHYRSY